MKIIENNEYYSVQSAWFIKQINAGDSENKASAWLDFKAAKMSLSAYQANFETEFMGHELRELRDFLSPVGLKRLNNAISAQIKRLKAKESDHKVLSITVPESVALKFSEMCRQKNLTMSEMIEKLTEGGVTKGFNFK